MEYQPNAVCLHSTEPSLQNFVPQYPEEATPAPTTIDPRMETQFTQYDWDAAPPVDSYLWSASLHVTEVPPAPTPHILPWSLWPYPDQQFVSLPESECQVYKTDCW